MQGEGKGGVDTERRWRGHVCVCVRVRDNNGRDVTGLCALGMASPCCARRAKAVAGIVPERETGKRALQGLWGGVGADPVIAVQDALFVVGEAVDALSRLLPHEYTDPDTATAGA